MSKHLFKDLMEKVETLKEQHKDQLNEFGDAACKALDTISRIVDELVAPAKTSPSPETMASVDCGLEDVKAGRVEEVCKPKFQPFESINWYAGEESEISDWELEGAEYSRILTPYFKINDIKYSIPPALLDFLRNLYEEGKAQKLKQVQEALNTLED